MAGASPKPFFTVIIPAYNGEKFVESAVACVKAQTFGDFEIIFIDNGSSDGTGKLAEKVLGASGLGYSIETVMPNKGIGYARNLGIRKARGTFCAFLDVDDVWYPEKLAKVKEAIDAHPDCDLFCHDENLWKKGKIVGRMTYGPWVEGKDAMYRHLLEDGNCLSGTATTLRKSTALEGGLFSEDQKFNGNEDYEFWLRLSRICRFHFIHEPLGEYRITGDNASLNVERQAQREIAVIESNLERLPPEERRKFNEKRRYAKIYLGLAWGVHRQGQFAQSRELYGKALAMDPTLLKAYAGTALAFALIKW